MDFDIICGNRMAYCVKKHLKKNDLVQGRKRFFRATPFFFLRKTARNGEKILSGRNGPILPTFCNTLYGPFVATSSEKLCLDLPKLNQKELCQFNPPGQKKCSKSAFFTYI